MPIVTNVMRLFGDLREENHVTGLVGEYESRIVWAQLIRQDQNQSGLRHG